MVRHALSSCALIIPAHHPNKRSEPISEVRISWSRSIFAPARNHPALGLLALLMTVSLSGCLGGGTSEFPILRAGREIEFRASNRVELAWTRVVNRGASSPYKPVEMASAALDVEHQRIYIGSAAGFLYAYNAIGKKLFEYEAGAPIDSAPAYDAGSGRVFLGTGDGYLHALDAATGAVVWKVNLEYPLIGTPLILGDALYIATSDNGVVAASKETGASLFGYRRPPAEDFTIKGRAGLLVYEDYLITGFDDGAIVAIDRRDGSAVWEYDTSNDIEDDGSKRPTFADVDTTPVLVGNELFVASFNAGLYRLNPMNGSVIARDAAAKGITDIQLHEEFLLITSKSAGLVVRDTVTDDVVWRRLSERGAISPPTVTETGVVFYGETPGSLLAIDLKTGVELARIESGEGFSARAATQSDLVAVLSNAGHFYAFKLVD